MSRVKRGVTSHHRHKRELERAKGRRGTKHRLVKVARESSLHAGHYALRDRRARKRQTRRLWIVRLNAAAREHGLTYSHFIAGLGKAQIGIDRKVLSAIAVEDPAAFKVIVDEVKKAIGDKEAKK
jgi:large subunit ribosomal protein L20